MDFLFWDILSQHVPDHHVTAWEVGLWGTVNHPCRAAGGHEDGDQHGLCSLDARARHLHEGSRDSIGVLSLVTANRVEVSPNENLLLGLLSQRRIIKFLLCSLGENVPLQIRLNLILNKLGHYITSSASLYTHIPRFGSKGLNCLISKSIFFSSLTTLCS